MAEFDHKSGKIPPKAEGLACMLFSECSETNTEELIAVCYHTDNCVLSQLESDVTISLDL